jgi:hypothetical protein
MPKVDIGVGELVDMIGRGELRLPATTQGAQAKRFSMLI